MEINIAIIGIGLIAFLNLYSYWKLNNKIDNDTDLMWDELMSLFQDIDVLAYKTKRPGY